MLSHQNQNRNYNDDNFYLDFDIDEYKTVDSDEYKTAVYCMYILVRCTELECFIHKSAGFRYIWFQPYANLLDLLEREGSTINTTHSVSLLQVLTHDFFIWTY